MTEDVIMGLFLLKKCFVCVTAILATVVMLGIVNIPRASAAEITVNIGTDSFDDDPSSCSLREAVQAANTDTAFDGCTAGDGDDIINIESTANSLSLTGTDEDNNTTGDLDIRSNVIIEGPDTDDDASTSIEAANLDDRVLHIHNGATVIIKGVTIKGGYVPVNGDFGKRSGGGIRNNGVLTLENCAVIFNTAAGSGGGITTTGPLTISDSHIDNNTAGEVGGGINIEEGAGGGSLSVTGGTISNNSVCAAGTAVETGTICRGGGIYVSGIIRSPDTNLALTLNTNPDGRLTQPATAVISGTTIQDNFAAQSGGGIFNVDKRFLIIKNNSLLKLNTSGAKGAGLFINGQDATVFIDNSTISENSVYTDTAWPNGGGIYNAGRLEMTSSTVKNNFTKNTGGGLFSTTYPTHISRASIIIDSKFEGNSADNNGGAIGGGVVNEGDRPGLTVKGTIIRINTANHSGGGILADKGTLQLVDSTVSENLAFDNGGGFRISQNADVTIKRSVITDNRATSGNGGGIINAGVLKVSESSLTENEAKLNAGGGIYNTGSLNIDSSTLYYNRAKISGGGVYNLLDPGVTIANAGTASITNSTFDYNQAGNSGGGIYADSGVVDLLHDTILNNAADAWPYDTGSGGGIHVKAGAVVNIYNSVIAENFSGAPAYRAQRIDHDCAGEISTAKNTMIGVGSKFLGAGPYSCTFKISSHVRQGAFYYPYHPCRNPLADNGGPTKTFSIRSDGDLMNLLFRSDLNCTAFDQRGVARDTNSCFLGSYELVCGDGNVAGNEACDDGNEDDDDACRNDCTLPLCGDGVFQISNGEACDDGNEVDNDECRNNCTLPSCGDSVVQAVEGEECDDGNSNNTDLCPTNCRTAICGDSFILAGAEVCDDGNAASGDGCRADCLGLEVCGDGLVDTGEVCDDGNAASGDGCRADCLGLEVCGDGLVDTGEECDTGAARSDNAADACRLNCRDARCGDGVKDGPEGCDDGNGVDNDECRNDCALPSCGDGVVQAGEGCDDANGDNTDECLNTCVIASCGDEFIQTDVETCDDGNRDSGDGCRSDCRKLERCGDGEIDSGEECDDSNTVGGDGCSPECQIEVEAPVEVIEGGSPASTTSAAPKAKGGCSLVTRR